MSLSCLQSGDLVYPEIVKGHIYTNVLLIDNTTPNYQTFSDSVNSTTFPIVYSSMSKKTDLLALLQTNFTSIDRIGLVFASVPNVPQMFLDSASLFSAIPSSENEQFMINIIKQFHVKNIDFLACNTLNYMCYVTYYSSLTEQTGVIVGASNDRTGNIKLGGDWVMESTSQNIEFIYFTQSIEYYKYLLDNVNWVSGLDGPRGLAVSGDFLYAANGNDNTISKIKISNPTIIERNWVSGLSGPRGLAVSGDYLYVANTNNNTISQILIATGIITKSDWVSGLSGPTGLAVSGDFLYAANTGNNKISQIRLSTGVKSDWVSGLDGPYGLAVSGAYLYVANIYNNKIIKILIATGIVIDYNWVSGLSRQFGLAVSGNYLYAANVDINTISLILIETGEVINSSWKGGTGPAFLTVDNGYLYASNLGNNTISQFNLPPSIGALSIPPHMYNGQTYQITPPESDSGGAFSYASSNPSVATITNVNTLTALSGTGETTITATQAASGNYTSGSVFALSTACFPAGTLITCDQGEIAIDQIDTKIHTIRGKKIVAITKTVSTDKYLVQFEKGALGNNIPSRDTQISKNHEILYNRQMIKAQYFVKQFEKVTKVKYNKEILYNILLENHDKMMVNNLICETLNPTNDIAKITIILKNMSPEEERQFIKNYNIKYTQHNPSNKKNI